MRTRYEEIRKSVTFLQRIGDILLVKMPRCGEEEKREIGRALLELHPRIKTVCALYRIEGELRKPKIEVIAGNGTVTIHREHGVLYKIDVSKVMFSKGNGYERKRLIELVKPGETIVDMFAGIGYFSLGLGKFSKCLQIISIEKNKDAYELLKENIALNRIEKIEPVLGDCREIAKLKEFKGIADRVIMGYLHDTEKFFPSALSFLKRRGMVHYHHLYGKRELWEGVERDVSALSSEYRCAIEILNRRRVKSYAPNVYHVVLDLLVEKR